MTLVLLNPDQDADVVRRIPAGEATREHPLRDLLFANPGIAPVHEIDPSYGRMFTVAKELNIPGVGFIDVLLADETGRLVLIECKLWRNPQARREVVGQILDYARELSRYGYEDLQRQISISRRRSGNILYLLARDAGCQLDEATFVDRVSRDLAAGRFLLLIVGDGITEGTRRIGEYLREQPGLAFTFGLVEIAEYRLTSDTGAAQVIVQPRVLAQTTLIERHVIRSDVPGATIELIDAPVATSQAARALSDAGQRWRLFVERFVAETQFDDPAQSAPRSGGTGWIRIPLPAGLYINAYRSSGAGQVGAEVRFPGAEANAIFAELLADREAIDAEFMAAALEAPRWDEGEVCALRLTHASTTPWDDAEEQAQRQWMGQAANQLINSLRPRLDRIERGLAA